MALLARKDTETQHSAGTARGALVGWSSCSVVRRSAPALSPRSGPAGERRRGGGRGWGRRHCRPQPRIPGRRCTPESPRRTRRPCGTRRQVRGRAALPWDADESRASAQAGRTAPCRSQGRNWGKKECDRDPVSRAWRRAQIQVVPSPARAEFPKPTLRPQDLARQPGRAHCTDWSHQKREIPLSFGSYEKCTGMKRYGLEITQ